MGLCSGIAPGLSCSGLLLPTTPLHALLAGQCNVPLVVTSGNVDGDPLAVAPEEAERSLADIADLFLHHDRPIAHPVDDSVVRVIADRLVTIRLARGLAPLPLPIPAPLRGLALGGQQKVAIALSNGSQAVLGPHLGDLDSLAMRRRFEGHVEEMLDLYDCRPRFVAIDHHPDYFTSRWVQQLGVPGVDVDESGLRREVVGDRLSDADSRGEPHRCFSDLQHIVRVQHHHAHIAAGMLECGWQNREVFGVAFDGTGSGTDGTIWGGEFLLCTLKSFRRVGRLRPFALPGGERAIREPWRVAISLLTHVLAPAELEEVCRRLFDESLVQHTALIQRSMRSAPVTTSAGRLFDGIAALVLQVHESSFEGQPALQLEDCCDPAESGRYDFSIESGPLHELDWRPAIGSIVDDLKAGVTGGRIAMKFHRGLASGVAKICARFQAYPVVLGGGVFQNRTLVEELSDRLPSSRLGLPGRIPPNDGGLAAGQLAIAAEIMSILSHH